VLARSILPATMSSTSPAAVLLEIGEQRLAALAAGFATGDAQLQQALIGEQGQAAGTLGQLQPVEAAFTGIQHLALAAAAGARGTDAGPRTPARAGVRHR
jgi:hypothetical protein